MIEIEYVKKDVTTVEKGIVYHGCNCQGVMGSGVAKAIRDKWPSAYQEYVEHCNNIPYEKLLGSTRIVRVAPGLFVYNALTQEYYGRDGSRYASPEAIKNTLRTALTNANVFDISDVYMPRVGCGLGGLDYEADLRPIIRDVISSLRPIVRAHTTLHICDLP